MDDLNLWLANKNRAYKIGYELFCKYSEDGAMKRVLVNCNETNERLLFRQLLDIYCQATIKAEAKPVAMLKRRSALYTYVTIYQNKLKANTDIDRAKRLRAKVEGWRKEILAINSILPLL